jgi:hypothetical protein
MQQQLPLGMKLFYQLDTGRDGNISFQEFAPFCQQMGFQIQQGKVRGEWTQ